MLPLCVFEQKENCFLLVSYFFSDAQHGHLFTGP